HTLVRQYDDGWLTDSPTNDFAAKCTTPSKSSWSRTRAASEMSACSKRAPSGMASACPVDRSSSTVTWCPSAISSRDTTEPMYPAPPATSTRIAVFLIVPSWSLRRHDRRVAEAGGDLLGCGVVDEGA